MRIFKYLMVLLVLAVVAGAGLAALTVWHFGRDLPAHEQLAAYEPAIVTRIHAGDGRLLAEYATERRVFVPIAVIPQRVVRAFLSAEDKNFYDHPGIDVLSVVRAAVTNAVNLGSNRRPVGASTITQQVAKNFLLTNEVSVSRKVKEALLALRIEQALSKDRILELYLNEIYLGSGAYGVAAAALTYFNKPLAELSAAEAAYLAALPKAPNNYHPVRHAEAAKARRDWVIERMLEEGALTPQEAAGARAEPLQARRRDEAEAVAASFFAEEVRRELYARYGEKGLYESGLSVRTSVDPTLQAAADRALRDGLVAYDRRHGYRGPLTRFAPEGDWLMKFAALPQPAGTEGWSLAAVIGVEAEAARIRLKDGTEGRITFEELKWARPPREDGKLGPALKSPGEALKAGDVVLVEPIAEAKPAGQFALRQLPEVSGALVALDPHTGRVLALSGGFSYELSQFDRATQAKRQPGSAIKPFVYAAALDHGFTPSTLVLDAPFVIDQGPGLPKWKPLNYTNKFYGPSPIRVGIEQSRNLMTARLAQTVGLEKVAQYVERFGIMDAMPRQYAMALGAGETTALRLTAAYAELVNGGKRIRPTFIDRIQDRNGKTVFRADERPCEGCSGVEWTGAPPPQVPDNREQLLDPGTAYQLVSMLQGVVDRGTARSVAKVGKPLAGKTGTTNDYRDAWFVGFSPDLAVGVYVGFDTPKTLGDGETGGTAAAPIFRDFMTVALKDRPAIAFRIPPGIRLVRVSAATGQLARPGDRDVIYEAFKPGTEPSGENVVISGVSDEDAAPAAVSAPVGNAVAAPPPAQRTTPASGTGGLY